MRADQPRRLRSVGADDNAGRPRADPPADRPQIQVGDTPATIRKLVQAIDAGTLPDTYVSNGQLVHVERVAGTAGVISGDDDAPLTVAASVVKPPKLAALLADHTFTFQARKDGSSQEVTPPANALAATLARKNWKLRPFFGIVGAPVLRPDGTLLQDDGYDEATGLVLASKVHLDPVPAEPTPAQVRAALDFLLHRFLHDFPWVTKADRANYLAFMVTPILRRYLRSLIPFSLVTASMPGSGKTILTCGLGMLYGQRVLTWTHDDAELRKTITSVLYDPVGTIIFDNIAEGSVIDSAVLAQLITDSTWADRILGKNQTAAFPNDRVWTATGNNLQLGGDMATRTVMIRLDPDMPHPEERTGFAIPSLDQWILDPANQRTVLWHLLVLVIDWTRAGAPRQRGITMRQFTPWAEALGGFLSHHGVPGFLANIDSAQGIDEDNAIWTAFLHKWHDLYPDKWMTAHELRRSAEPGDGGYDLWDGVFILDGRGKIPTPVALGKRLLGQLGRWRGPYVLRSQQDRHRNVRTWRVERPSESARNISGAETTLASPASLAP